MSQMKDKQPKKLWQTRYFWLAITPLLITLIALALVNILLPEEETAEISSNSPTAVSTPRLTPATTGTRPPILPATILPTAVPTPAPTPEPESATITLLGPPAAATLSENSQLAFYWRYSQPLPPNQQFVLTLQQNGITVASQPVDSPNLGDNYQFLLDLADSSFASGTLIWQIQLQESDDKQVLITSEERTLVLLPNTR